MQRTSWKVHTSTHAFPRVRGKGVEASSISFLRRFSGNTDDRNVLHSHMAPTRVIFQNDFYHLSTMHISIVAFIIHAGIYNILLINVPPRRGVPGAGGIRRPSDLGDYEQSRSLSEFEVSIRFSTPHERSFGGFPTYAHRLDFKV